MKHFIPIVLLIFIVGCSDSNNSKSSVNINSLPSKTSITNFGAATIIPKQKETLNFTDSNGLKQGKWVKKWRGKIVSVKHYKDNLLHGYYLDSTYLPVECNYVNGKKEGMLFGFYNFKKKVVMVETFYKNGVHIWTGYPASGNYFLIPIKKFCIYKDSVFIQAPVGNGIIWYEGNFCLRYTNRNKQKMTYAYGIHKVYFKNGKLKGIVDYDKQTIQEFDTNGSKLYKAKFSEFEIHKQMMIKPY